MEVISARSALLSNYEVLKLLKELESDHLARTKTALRIKKEEEQANLSGASSASKPLQPPQDEICENLRTVEFEAIQYLSAEYQPLHQQTEASITQLVKRLSRYDLTKAEKLQIVNLAPTEAVELYVIVEELEDRLADKMEDVLDVVRGSLTASAPEGAEGASASATAGTGAASASAALAQGEAADAENNVEEWNKDAHTIVWDEGLGEEFDDTGEGAGVAGDLEMEED